MNSTIKKARLGKFTCDIDMSLVDENLLRCFSEETILYLKETCLENELYEYIPMINKILKEIK